jgi:hypothetical protein
MTSGCDFLKTAQPAKFFDPASTNLPERFYRARLPQPCNASSSGCESAHYASGRSSSSFIE